MRGRGGMMLPSHKRGGSMDIGASLVTAAMTIVGLTGGGIILWLLQKPKVKITSVSELGWYHSYCGEKINSSVIRLKVGLINRGTEDTNVDAECTVSGMSFVSEETYPFPGKGMRKNVEISLELSRDMGMPKDGQEMQGMLKLHVWANRRLWFFGKATLQREIVIPCIQDYRLNQGFKRG